MFNVKSLNAKFKAYFVDLIKGKRKGAQDALFCFFLLLFSFIYGFFVKLILFCYEIKVFKSYRPDCRVISVGNITWGGTGKTPLVESIVKFLKKQGKNPAILIRGYGKDEVYMLKDRFKDIPVLAGRDRIKSARCALKQHAVDTIILDDGFQHWRIKRDRDIVLIDSNLPFGNRRLIPCGMLREPLSSLNRADIFVLTRTNESSENIELIKKELRRYNPQAPIYEAIHSPTFLRSLTSAKEVELSAIKNQPIALVSAIAHPESFTKTVESLNAKISLKFCFPDHYRYDKEDLGKIERQCEINQVKIIVTTEKDAAKLSALLKSQKFRFEVLALCIELKIVKDEEKFFRSLEDKKGPYSILILSDGKAGHLNQSKTVAGLIQKRKKEQGVSEDMINIKVTEAEFKNRFCQFLLNACSIFASPYCRRCFRCLRFCLKKDSFYELMQSSADIIVSAGSALSSVNLLLSYRNRARKIILMKPSFLSLDRFDLAIVPEHDRIKPKENVVLTRITPNLIEEQYLEEQTNVLRNRLKAQGSELKAGGLNIGVLIGGDTLKYKLTSELANKVIQQLKEAADNFNCQLLVTTSRRTSHTVEDLLRENLADFSQCKLLVIANEKNIPEAVGGILGLSDVILVSGESISMISEAVSAEKYVLVFKPEKKAKAVTKQERFLERLEREQILKVIQPDSLFSEIKKFRQEKPERQKIEDRKLIYQALSKII